MDVNFEENFFDVRKHNPEKDQVLVKYKNFAEFVGGWVKEQVVHLLSSNIKGGELAPRVIQKLACATESSALRLSKDMVDDLLADMPEEEVLSKPYEFVYEQFFWANKTAIPAIVDDPKWEVISSVDLSEYSSNFSFKTRLQAGHSEDC